MIDIAIIGAGPAGLSAAVNAAARNKTCVVLGREKSTSWLYKAEQVNNHLGAPGQSGRELIESFYAHAARAGVAVKTGRVLQVMPFGGAFTVNFDNELIEARSVIIATGKPRFAGAEGESELLGKGVSYCATCDGMLYRGKHVVVAGEIPEGEEDANFLSEICGKVYYVHKYDEPPGLKENVEAVPGIVDEVLGEDFVTGARVGQRDIACDGVFFVKESVPFASLIPGLATEDGAIKVNRLMETNVRGVFAAGDCTGWPYQLSNAIGEGLVAAQQCARYLQNDS